MAKEQISHTVKPEHCRRSPGFQRNSDADMNIDNNAFSEISQNNA